MEEKIKEMEKQGDKTCARRVATGVVSPRAIESHCTSGKPLPFAARPWCDVPGAASRTAGFRVTSAWARHCASYLLGGGAARALAMRARRAAMSGGRSMHD